MIQFDNGKGSWVNLLPLKLRVTRLGTSGEQVVSPDVGVNASILGVVAKHTDVLGLAELSTLVVEVFCGRKMVDLGPLLSCAELSSGEDDGVEPDVNVSKTRGIDVPIDIMSTRKYSRNVVFAHELIKGHLIGVLPPLLPVSTLKVALIGIRLGDRSISNYPASKHERSPTGKE